MNIPDNSKFETMVKNRPSLDILPSINKRILGQYHARNLYLNTTVALISGLFLYKFWINTNSTPFVKSRKSFSFQSDPYSNKVSCNFSDVPNFQHGYWSLKNPNNVTILSYHYNCSVKWNYKLIWAPFIDILYFVCWVFLKFKWCLCIEQ